MKIAATRSVFLFMLLIISCEDTKNGLVLNEPDQSTKAKFGYEGYHGYIGYNSSPNSSYGSGVSFYTAAWKLVDDPLFWLQIGLPGTWIIPDNTDNSTALCPPGTLASNWTERGPTWSDVFQTLEGGLGYWRGNKYRYGPPKFSMNATPQCYDYEVASPGWSFFYDDQALQDNLLGIAQLSNRLLIPPDAITFEGDPQGEFMGYAYMALPLTDAYNNGTTPVGNQSWTCFINTENFKGPIAYYLPETWAKLSESYPEIEGKGLDNKKGIIHGGAMEINTVPKFEANGPEGTLYIKVPKLNFSVDGNGEALLVQDLRYYNENAIFNTILDWRNDNTPFNGVFNEAGMIQPDISAYNPYLRLSDHEIKGLNNVFSTFVKNNGFGFKWAESEFEVGSFPEYYKKSGDVMIPIKVEEVPEETKLLEAEFPLQDNQGIYTSPNYGSWVDPGPADGPYNVMLNDGSTLTYYWYKFIDQPVFNQYNWDNEKRGLLQSLIEKIHKEWDIDSDYIPSPTVGKLVRIDNNLIVSPPSGLEYGYVPIVVNQSL